MQIADQLMPVALFASLPVVHRYRRSSMTDSLQFVDPSTVVVHNDGTAGREQTRWNAWLAEGEQHAHGTASPRSR